MNIPLYCWRRSQNIQ